MGPTCAPRKGQRRGDRAGVPGDAAATARLHVAVWRTADRSGKLYGIYLLTGRQRGGICWRTRECARRFYEALGGHYLREKTIEIAGVTLDEVAYG